MSSVEPCLETQSTPANMETSVEFLDSFKTVDEDKDSDEESFHLFLDADEEFNKSDDKSPLAEVNNTNEEEKEKVNEPIREENENSPIENEDATPMEEKGTSLAEENVVSKEEKVEDKENSNSITKINNEEIKNTIDEENNQCSNEEITEKEKEHVYEKDTAPNKNKIYSEENISLENKEKTTDFSPNQNKINEVDENKENKHDSQPQNNENRQSEVNMIYSDDKHEKIENREKLNDKDAEIEAVCSENKSVDDKLIDSDVETTENEIKSAEKESEKTESTNNDENEIPSETEDEILNKNSTDFDTLEDVDPNLEETLLNDCEQSTEEFHSKEDEPAETNMEIELGEPCNKIQNCEVKNSDELNEIKKTDSEVLSEVEPNCDKNKNSVSTLNDPLNSQSCDDNSNDMEDLLDISMIKDSAQDDADIAEDAFQLEQENEETDGNNQSSNRKSIELETADDSSNLENSDEDGKGYSSETQDTTDNIPTDSLEKEKDFQDNEDETEVNLDKEIEGLQNDEEMTETNGLNDDDVIEDIEESTIENTEKVTSKRTLSEEDDADCEPKKIKLTTEDMKKSENLPEDKIDGWNITELQSLISFSKFMTKSHLKQLTRKDLEEFCVQKLCEAILHKSELGETNHQLKIQEQTIESLRKEQSILTKQIKDLEIVNKKLMHEVKCHIGNKPIIPVRITRSVGLQVRMAQPEVNGTKRRSNQMTPQKTPPAPTGTQSPIINNTNRTPRPVQTNNNNTPITRQILAKSPAKPQQQTTTILDQVLQQTKQRAPFKNVLLQSTQVRTTAKLNNVAPSSDKKAKTTGSSFIDLTDEDDKRTNNTASTIQAIVPQGVRINSIPKTSAISTVLSSVVSSNAPQLMYVVQSNSQLKQGLLTTPQGQQKTVLVNFQPTNGMINALNTSSVSVIPKMTTNVQLKASPIIKLNKHPAPLPNQPLVQGPGNKNLKGIPPKPELSIRKTNTGIILQWRMPYELGLYESIASYQLYAYQETAALPSTDMWRKVGDVKAMALPMACTLTQFPDKNKYYFAVRPVDIHKRIGKFSDPEEISL